MAKAKKAAAKFGLGDVGTPRFVNAFTAPIGRTYRVIGPQPVHGAAPGGTFTKQLSPSQEAFLLEVGHIELADAE